MTRDDSAPDASRAPARTDAAAAPGNGASIERGVLGQLVRNAADVIHVIDRTGRVVYVNDAVMDVLGYSPAEVVGRRAAAFVHPDDRRRVLSRGAGALDAPGFRGRIEARVRHADGGYRRFEVAAQTVLGDDGGVLLVGQGRSVTKARAAVEALRESEARFRLMVEGSEAVFFYEHDRDHRFTYLSPSIEQVLGYRPAELLGQRYDVLLAPDPDNEDVQLNTDTAIETGRKGSFYEALVLDRDGNSVVLELAERPLVEDGTVVGLQGFARDVTARHRSQVALRESQQRYRALVENSPDAIAVHVQGRLVYVNPQAARMAGVEDPDVLVGRSVFDLLHPSVHEEVAEFGRRMIDQGRQQDRMDMTFVLPDGTVRHGEVSATLLTWEGSPAFQVVVRDMSKRKRTEQALRQSEERFRSLIENSRDIVAVLDDAGTIHYHSPSTVEMLGYEPAELEGRNVLDLIHPDDVPAVQRELAALVDAPDTAEPLELQFRHKDGGWRVLEVLGSNRLDDPAVAGLVLNSRDVTEERALQLQLRRAQKMEAVGRLAGGMAHDFNNLLTAIRGHAEFLRDCVEGEPVGDVDEILKNTDRATDLIQQLLAFARQQVLHIRVVDIRDVVAGAETLLRRLIGEDLDFTIDTGEDLLPVEADLGQLEQVLMNLAVNARDAMPTGGALTIRLDEIDLSADDVSAFPFQIPDGEYVRMVVEDTGEGIQEENLEQVFEPFFTTKQPGRGTGLGLSTVYGIVKQSGGYIHVDSKPGKGTTFQVFLPRAQSDPDDTSDDATTPAHGARADAARAARDASGAGTTGAGGLLAGTVVLLVEDEQAVRTISRRVLERAGCEVIESANPLDAVNRILPERADDLTVLVTDVVMPDMGGHELARRVADRCPGIYIVYMSGYTGSEIVQRGIIEEGAPFLQKPFSPADLVRVVQKALE